MVGQRIFFSYCPMLLLIVVIFSLEVNCYEEPAIGSRCRYDEDCFTEHAFCFHHEVCACKDGFIVTDDLQRCIATVGGVCRSKHDCTETLANSLCVEQQCACNEGFVPDSYQLNCVQVALAVGDVCSEDIQCQETMGDFSHCMNQHCYCFPDHHFINGKCSASRKLYEPCTSWHDCFIGKEYNNSVDCINGVCKCKQNFYHSADNKCLRVNSAPTTTDDMFTYVFVLLTVYFTVFN